MQVARLIDPTWWRFHRQRRVDRLAKRQRAADRIARAQPRPGERRQSDALSADGYLMLPPLGDATVAEMRAYFAQHETFDPYRRDRGLFRSPQDAPAGTHVANYPDEVVVKAPHVASITNDPEVLALVSEALGCKPTIAHMSAWWSIPAPTPAEHAELWRRDVDDYRFIKLFCYLTDVDENSGPHGFVRGSHLVDKLTTAGRRIPDEEVRSAFGCEKILSFDGKAGTMFLENTYGVHRGNPPRTTPRLLFQVLYAQRPIVYSPKKPVAKGTGADPWINRLFYDR